jgi:ribosomal protein S18 acetylase RimI-like enzyme
MSAHRDLTRGDGRLRIATWRGDTTTAYLTPARGRLTAAVIERSLGELERDGYRSALTAALGPAEQAPFLAAGFSVREHLHLLTRSIGLPLPPSLDDVPLRRSRRGDREQLLTVDRAAFPPFWRLDGAGLDDALAATPSSRLRVSDRPDGSPGLGAYAVTGRAGPRGYLQRLAVDPGLQRRGIGSALVVDALRWLRRWGAREALVNTQEDNSAALALYESLGFRLQAEGLAVLRRAVHEGDS